MAQTLPPYEASLGSQAVRIYPPPCTPPPSPLGINGTENLPESLSAQVPCTGPFASAQQLFRKWGSFCRVQPIPSVRLPALTCSFILSSPFPSAPRPPSRPDSSQSLGLPLPQGAFPPNPPAAWLVLTVLLYPSGSHPQSTKPSPEALNPSFIAHSSLVLHKSEIEKFSEKVKKTPQSLLGAAKACGVPHSHPARAGKSPCLWPLASLLSGPHPAPRPGAQDGKQASSQSGSRKGAVNHLDPAAI